MTMRLHPLKRRRSTAAAVALLVLGAACSGGESATQNAGAVLGDGEAEYVRSGSEPIGRALTTLPTSGVVVSGTSGAVCYAHDGDEQWRYELPDGKEIVGRPAIAPDSTTYLLARDALFAISIDGELLWSVAVEPAGIPAVIALGDSTVVVTSGTDTLVSYSDSGRLQWRFRLPDGDTICSLPRAANNSQIYVQGSERLYVVEPSGVPLWDRAL